MKTWRSQKEGSAASDGRDVQSLHVAHLALELDGFIGLNPMFGAGSNTQVCHHSQLLQNPKKLMQYL